MEQPQFKEQLIDLKKHIQQTLNTYRIICSLIENNDSLSLKLSTSQISNSIEIQISYSHSYNTPILLFKTYTTTYEEDPDLQLGSIETIRAIYTNPYDYLKIPPPSTSPLSAHESVETDPYSLRSNFQITLTQWGNSNWWMVHPCDFESLLQNSRREDYLINWWSVYTMSSFTTLRSTLVHLDTQLNVLLTKYSKFAISVTSEPTGEETKTVNSIESSLQKYDTTLSQLSRIADSESTVSSVNLSHLARHKDSIANNWKHFLDIKNSILEERNKLNLLFNVREDLNEYKQRNKKIGNDEESQMDYIQNESQRVNNLNSITDDLIQGVLQTRDNLLGQRQSLNLNTSTIMNTLSNVPGINIIIGKINTRRRRDSMIIAGVITVCIPVGAITPGQLLRPLHEPSVLVELLTHGTIVGNVFSNNVQEGVCEIEEIADCLVEGKRVVWQVQDKVVQRPDQAGVSELNHVVDLYDVMEVEVLVSGVDNQVFPAFVQLVDQLVDDLSGSCSGQEPRIPLIDSIAIVQIFRVSSQSNTQVQVDSAMVDWVNVLHSLDHFT
ncbi:hypothetical protein WICPIJ_006821 [Wickerhamomyces pijperi]|uniref:Uncharacterized protein n=1 Tax=Wickerhamomyces pijperi TaxID=599730 RepID=A0A9P8Q306_WICPI|nr:hypothetical protein WICPIJ_006821 [Wickerhamomyces pijperi]